MRLVAVSGAIVGERLAHSVTDVFGQVLIRAGSVLTARYVDHLLERGYARVYVADEASADIALQDACLLEAQSEAARTLRAAVGPRQPRAAGGTLAALEHAVRHLIAELRTNVVLGAELASLRSASDYAFSHAVHVCTHALAIGSALGLPQDQLAILGVGALLQDVGNLRYADIWNRPGRLSAAEFMQLQAHTRDGFEIVAYRLGYDLRAAHMALQHHERLDGSGYPRHLREEQIMLFARAGAIADIYDALCSARPHRPATPPPVAMRLLRALAGSKLDADLVMRFAERTCVFPTGSPVLLASGEVALVAAQTPAGPAWPRVRVLTDPRLDLVVPFEVDLSPDQPARAIRRLLPGIPTAVRTRLARAG